MQQSSITQRLTSLRLVPSLPPTSVTLHGASSTTSVAHLPPWWLVYHLGDSSTTLVAQSSADKRRSKNFMYFSTETRFTSESECFAAAGWATLHIVLITDNALYNNITNLNSTFTSLTILAGVSDCVLYFLLFPSFMIAIMPLYCSYSYYLSPIVMIFYITTCYINSLYTIIRIRCNCIQYMATHYWKWYNIMCYGNDDDRDEDWWL